MSGTIDGADARPLFLLSFRQRDELAAMLAGEGWRMIAARRGAGVGRRFAASGATIALIDARGAIDDGLAALAELAPVSGAQGAAVLVLVSKGDSGALSRVYDAGATHFLVSPMTGPEIAQALRFAGRYVAGTGGGPSRDAIAGSDSLGLRYDPALRSLQVTPALAARLKLGDDAGIRALIRALTIEDRALALAAMRRLGPGGGSTAFAHELAGIGRSVTHLQRDPDTGRIHALIEPLGRAPDPRVELRDVLSAARDAPAARRWIGRRLDDGVGVAAILIGIGQVAALNTVHGRGAVDALLASASKRLGSVARELLGRQLVVARVGGAEFVIAVADPDPVRLELAMVRAGEALAAPFLLGDRPVAIEARTSVAWSAPGDNAAALLRRASEGLVEPPGIPANATAASASVADQALDQLARDIIGAIDGEQVEILFQPQVAIASGAIIGVEALARWAHPALGELGAETLFAAAARAGMSLALSDHVQRRALDIARRWPAVLETLRLSVNVTAEDVARTGFADVLLDRIDASGFPRARLTIEITESGLIEELGEAARLLAELRTAGCRVAIDDFGTGYSSLAYLKALPLDYLKIDRKLSQDITGSARDRVVVRGVIEMARSLGLSVIAEGVETEQQLELLAKEGCQYFQGFLCSEPISDEALAALVAT